MDKIKLEKEKWEEEIVSKSLKKLKERDEVKDTERLYTSASLEPNWDYLTKLSFPGMYPFTRGIQPTMYRARIWTMRQYAGYGDAYTTNQRFKFLLSKGQTGLSVAFDLPTQLGYDSDHELSQGEVGKCGVAISSLADFKILFDGIPLDKVSTSMTINSPAAILLCMYLAIAEEQNIPFDKLRGTIQNDVLKEYTARGTYIFAPKHSLRLITDTIIYCIKNIPNFNPISISGYHMREAGCSAAQEVGFTLANAICYVEEVINRGINIDEFAPRLSFFFASHNNLLEEVAKFRASRRLWARIMKERFKAKTDAAMLLRFHTQTAGCTLTHQQPENNIVRVTLQALAAVLGGTQSLHTNSKDEAYCTPSEEAALTALRTQQIIAYESGVCDTVDPLGGSYYVEYLTDKIEREAEEYIKNIDEMGGAVKAIEKGYIQKEIQDNAYKYQQEIENKERIIVGVNEFKSDVMPKLQLLKVDENVERHQIERLNKLRKERNNTEVRNSLKELKIAAEKLDENLLPYIFNCVKTYSTIGEICDTLREVFGVYKES